MDWQICLLLMYLGGNVLGLNECYKCECCKNGFKSCGYNNLCSHGCINGYYGEECSHACKENCLICSDGLTCQECSIGYYGDLCKKCPFKCLACSSESNCSTCRNGFYNKRYNDSNSNFDNDCRYKCRDRCKSCTSYNACTECIDGKYNGDHNDCREGCNPLCKACTSFNECTMCEDGKYGKLCKNNCGLGCEKRQCDINTGLCNCITSFRGDKCDKCVSGTYGMNCNIKCPGDCLNNDCSPSGDCVKCKDRFTGNKCNKCVSGLYGTNCNMSCPAICADNVCSRTGYCTSGCKHDLTELNCSLCIDGKYGKDCDQNCSDNCLRCVTGNICTLCSPRHWGSQCLPCPLNCSNCSSDSVCLACDPGYYGAKCNAKCPSNCLDGLCDKTNGTCLSCTDGFYGNSCNKICPKHCAGSVCSFDGKCKSCMGGYYGDSCTSKCFGNCGVCHIDTGDCQTCIDGYYGSECNMICPQCKTCNRSTGQCTVCAAGSYLQNYMCYLCGMKCKTCEQSYKKCTACVDGKYGKGTSYLHCSSDCPKKCLNTSCDVKTGDCIYGCVTGYWGDKCKQNCPKNCNDGECYINNGTCVSGCKIDYSGPECTCPINCECSANGRCIETCDSTDGTCTAGCKSGYWGVTCDSNCANDCLECKKVDGECYVCSNGKYLKNCSGKCSTNCNSTDGILMCAIGDGSCLNGCASPTKYGPHCEKKCSRNCLNNTCDGKTGTCLKGCIGNFYGEHCDNACSNNCVSDIHGGTSCDDVSGYCNIGCKDGRHGNTCEKKCSDNCVNNICHRETGNCTYGCENGYTGSNCIVVVNVSTTTLVSTDKDEGTTTVNVGAAVGASLFVLIITTVAALIAIHVVKRRRRIDRDKRDGETGTNDSVTVTYTRILSSTPEYNQNNTVNVMPNKPKKNDQDSTSSKESKETRNVSKQNDAKYKPVEEAVYQNTLARNSPKNTDNENSRNLIVSAFEIEDLDSISKLEEIKMMANTASSYTSVSEADDTYYNAVAMKRRIVLDQLADCVSKMTKDDFIEEFLQLPPGLLKPCTEAQKRVNISQNRYKGIYAYDDTRVVLKEGDSDYINASYIDGYIKRRAYIASLGPTYKYMGDMSAFWRMVWQENVGKIVMLTNLSEAGISKCDQYWPDKDFSQLYADVQVTCHSEEIYADYALRFFVAQKGSEKRSIGQVHFTAWPDKGIPDGVTSMVEFRQKVNSIKTNLDGPLLVHCSAGIGRTGTYIALNRLTIEGQVEGGVDIFACVRNMREQRVNMVQTAEQYRYLYNAVVHTLTFDSNAVEATKFSEYVDTHTESHFEETFHKLQAFVESRPEDEIEAVKRNKTLKDKNRKGADIPGDRNRPRLYLNQHPGSSDYINALYINSFKSRNRYLVAQTPLPDTVDDFLRLIVQENVSCIIDMESDMTKNKNVGVYYPDGNQTLGKGSFTIKSEPGENTDQYIVRNLKILNHKKSTEFIVKHIQFTKWDDEKKTPDEPGTFVQFVKDIEVKYCDGEKEGPVLVHCLTGAEKSGLFCVVSILLEKSQVDQEISVVNTVRQIKYSRHMAIPNKEQFIFCHKCLNYHRPSFDTYANVSLNG